MNLEKTYGVFFSGGDYLPGIVALRNSLLNASSAYPLSVFTNGGLSVKELEVLASLRLEVITVDNVEVPIEIVETNKANGFYHWNKSFDKLRVFSDKIKKIILLDADMLVVSNIDSLFDKPHLSAVVAGNAANPTWCELNSGLMVIEPAPDLTDRLLAKLGRVSDKDLARCRGLGDQDIINMFWPEWPAANDLHLPETYNMFSDLLCKYVSDGFIDRSEIKVIHYEMSPKPWRYSTKNWLQVGKRAIKHKSTVELHYLIQYLNMCRMLSLSN
ncbi:MAG: glycosyltransferase [Gordonibacter pamelaeae]